MFYPEQYMIADEGLTGKVIAGLGVGAIAALSIATKHKWNRLLTQYDNQYIKETIEKLIKLRNSERYDVLVMNIKKKFHFDITNSTFDTFVKFIMKELATAAEKIARNANANRKAFEKAKEELISDFKFSNDEIAEISKWKPGIFKANVKLADLSDTVQHPDRYIYIAISLADSKYSDLCYYLNLSEDGTGELEEIFADFIELGLLSITPSIGDGNANEIWVYVSHGAPFIETNPRYIKYRKGEYK